MRIKDIFETKQVVFSLEVFPPSPEVAIENIYQTLAELKDIDPDYISVTYGAGGAIKKNRTVELSTLLKEKYDIEALAHLTCINSSPQNIDRIMTELKNNKIENILALRGDKPISGEIQGDYTHAWQLIEQIKQSNDFGVAAACYPEGHLEAQNMREDLNHLKYKVEAGVDYLITQMFFDNSLFYRFREQANNYGIKIPIEAGIMPVINKKQVGKIIELSGAYFPEKFKRIMLKYQDNPVALQDAGIAYAIEQIVDLISSEVDGIHLYTMNNPYVAKRIKSAVGSLISHINGLKNRQKNSPSLDKEH